MAALALHCRPYLLVTVSRPPLLTLGDSCVPLQQPSTSCSTSLKPNSITLSWSQTGPRLVADLQRAGIWPITSSELVRASRSATSFGPVYDQNSVMEFGLYRLNTYGCRAFSVTGPTVWNSPGFYPGPDYQCRLFQTSA